MNEHFKTLLDLHMGKNVSEESIEKMRDHDLRYALIRWLYMDHFSKKYTIRDGDEEIKGQLKDFHFSPACDLSEVSVFSVLQSLIELESKSMKSMKFGDSLPPSTGKEKKSLL